MNTFFTGMGFAIFFGLPTAMNMRLGFMGIVLGMGIWFLTGIAFANWINGRKEKYRN